MPEQSLHEVLGMRLSPFFRGGVLGWNGQRSQYFPYCYAVVGVVAIAWANAKTSEVNGAYSPFGKQETI
ncbi:hypothetical protein D3C81_970940 [compost metagenome]